MPFSEELPSKKQLEFLHVVAIVAELLRKRLCGCLAFVKIILAR